MGYGGTKTEMERLLRDAEQMAGYIEGSLDISKFADVAEAIHIIQEEMGIMGTTADEAAGTISGSVASMKAAWSDWLVGLADQNADLSGLTDNLVNSLETVFKNIKPVIARIGESIGMIFTDLTGIDLSPIIQKLSEFGSGISKTFSSFSNAFASGGFSGVVDEIVSKIKDLTGIDISIFTGRFKLLAESIDGFIAGGVSGAIESLTGSFEELTGIDLGGVKDKLIGVGESIDSIGAAFLNGGVKAGLAEMNAQFMNLTGIDVADFFGKVSNSIKNIDFSKFTEKTSDIIDKIKGWFTGPEATKSLDGIKRLGESLVNFLKSTASYFVTLWELVKPVVDLIIDVFLAGVKAGFAQLKDTFDMVINVLADIFNIISTSTKVVTAVLKGDFEGAGRAIMEQFSNIGQFFKDIWDGIVETFENQVNYFKDIGTRMWEGLKSGFSAAVEGIKEIGSNIVSGIKGIFGIHSPSRVFGEIGKFMAQGLEKGWDSEIDSVVRSMSDGINVHGNVDFSSSSIGKSSAAAVNGIMAASSQSGGNYSINFVVDGRTLANVIFDPLNEVSRQKGVAVGA